MGECTVWAPIGGRGSLSSEKNQKNILHIITNRSFCVSMDSDNIQASHWLWGSTGLKMHIHAHFFRRAILTREVGQTGLVFGVWWGFISTPVLVAYMWHLRFGILCFHCHQMVILTSNTNQIRSFFRQGFAGTHWEAHSTYPGPLVWWRKGMGNGREKE